MKNRSIFIIAMLLLATVFTYCQNKDSLLEYYNNEIITIICPFRSDINLSINGITSSIGMKMSPIIIDKLNQYPASKDLFNEFKKEYKSGNILLGTGLSGLFISSIIFALNNRNATNEINFYDSVNITSISGMIIGSIIEFVGASKISSSQENLFNSINLYNHEKIKEYSDK